MNSETYCSSNGKFDHPPPPPLGLGPLLTNKLGIPSSLIPLHFSLTTNYISAAYHHFR